MICTWNLIVQILIFYIPLLLIKINFLLIFVLLGMQWVLALSILGLNAACITCLKCVIVIIGRDWASHIVLRNVAYLINEWLTRVVCDDLVLSAMDLRHLYIINCWLSSHHIIMIMVQYARLALNSIWLCFYFTHIYLLLCTVIVLKRIDLFLKRNRVRFTTLLRLSNSLRLF